MSENTGLHFAEQSLSNLQAEKERFLSASCKQGSIFGKNNGHLRERETGTQNMSKIIWVRTGPLCAWKDLTQEQRSLQEIVRTASL